MNRKFFYLALALFFAVGIFSPCPALSREPSSLDSASQVTEITLKRTPCYGPCPVDEIILRADGTAQYSGNLNTSRRGQFKGKIHHYTFERLALWLISQGFMKLDDEYGDWNIDGSNEIISVARGEQRKTVTNQNRGDLALWGMENAVRGVAADIEWQPEPSGIRGTATWRPKTSQMFPGAPIFRVLSRQIVMIRREGEQQTFRLHTDKNGKFELPLRPGTYRVELWGGIIRWDAVSPQQTVVVQADKWSEVTFAIDKTSEK